MLAMLCLFWLPNCPKMAEENVREAMKTDEIVEGKLENEKNVNVDSQMDTVEPSRPNLPPISGEMLSVCCCIMSILLIDNFFFFLLKALTTVC